MHEFGENAVQADADRERAFPRLDMDVARARLDGIEDDAVYEDAGFNVVFGSLGLQILDRVVHGQMA